MLASRKSRAALAALAGLVGYDLAQRRRAVLRNFPLVGHLRYLLEAFGPELRQYIVTSNNEERPFSRDQRRWIYASAEGRPNVFGFGTDDEVEAVESADDRQAVAVPGARAGRRRARLGAGLRGAGGEGARRRARPPPRLPPGLGGQRLGDELRLALAGRDRGAQPRRGARRLPAEHRRGRHLRVPPPRRRARLPDRHRLLRLPRRGRPLLARAAARAGRRKRRCGRSRSSSPRAPSRASAACCRRPR